jgi:hypothetical protein
MTQRSITVHWFSLIGGVLLCLVTIAPLDAADIRYVNSPTIDLNVRHGPGTEHTVVTRLPHGTAVTLRERLGLWYRVTFSQGNQEGWVLGRYLSLKPPPPTDTVDDMSVEQEEQRFARLRSKGIIRTYTDNAQVLRIMIDPLIWRRLTTPQRENFLQRAHRLHGNTVVEARNVHDDSLLNRLTVTGDSFAFEGPPPPPPETEAPAPTPPLPPLPSLQR